MNELTTAPPNKGNFLNKLFPFVIVIFLFKGFPQINNIIESFANNVGFNKLKLNKDTMYNLKKTIFIVKKVGPYLPEETITVLNNFMPTIDRISKIIVFLELISDYKPYEPIIAAKDINDENRLSKIVSVVKEEIPQDKVKKYAPILDIVTNIDKYKVLLELLTSFTNPHEGSNKIQMENMIDLIIPLIGGEDEKSKNKVKDMVQMMEVLKLLSSDEEKKDKK